MGKSTPAPVDFEGAAVQEAEAARNIAEQQTWANRPTQINPWGRVDWTNTPEYDPTTGENINKWTQEVSLTPGVQEALDAQIAMQAGRSGIAAGMLGNLGQAYQTPVGWEDFGGMMAPDIANNPDLWGHLQWDIPQYETTGQVRQLDFSGMPGVDAPDWTVQRAEDAHYDRQKTRLDEQFGSQQQALDIKLRNQGLTPGDEAYQAQMQNLGRTMNDAYQNARNESIMAGGAEAQRMFGMQKDRRGMFTDEMFGLGNFANQAAMNEWNQRLQAGQQGFADTLAAAQFQNQARQQGLGEKYQQANYYNKLREQAINEALMRRSYTLNEMMAIMQGQQVGMPQFTGFNQAVAPPPPQYLNAADMTAQQNAAISGAKNAGMESLMGGLGSAAGMIGMFSDRRLKSNIRKIGERNGVNWYEYDIFGKHQIGVMADEVPWAAFEHPSGYLMVDYGRI